jgi:AcrR family transcriptional regulator
MAVSARTNTRSTQTREALLAAACEVFGRDGFHAASTRAIAEAAGVNQALIAYHFGGKEGLYLAVFENITQTMNEHIGPVHTRIKGEIDSLDGSTAEGRRACLAFIDQLLGGAIAMFSQPAALNWTRMVMREQQDPSDAFDIFYGGIYREMLASFTQLMARLTGQPADAEGTRIQALNVMGQLMMFMVGRATAMRHLGWAEVGPQELSAVRREIRAALYQRFDEEVPE